MAVAVWLQLLAQADWAAADSSPGVKSRHGSRSENKPDISWLINLIEKSRLFLLFLLAAVLLLSLDPISIRGSEAVKGQRSGRVKYCGKRFDDWRDKICKWPGEGQPCLQLHHNIKERVKTKCCESGCNVEEIKEACCLTQPCLDRCYPGKGYRVGSVY